MRPRHKQRDNFVQSLFPFLAVLLSTMGALVLLLMLIVNQAQAAAKQMATEKKMQIEDAEARLDMLRGSFEEKLDDRRLDIERKRLTLQHLEKHIQELIDELKSLERTATLLDSKQTQDKAGEDENDRKISQLEKQLVDANIDLKKKLDNPEGNKPIFAIIPYQGTNGTHRRPIYLECTDKGVIIQPEGVLIGIGDLRPPYGPGNPLDAAIRTVRSRFVPASGALTSTAYPLLVVRPSGVRTYAMARQAMSGWDDQFGYELIDEQLELTFPESEPGVAAEVEQALVLARERQAALVMAMPAKFRQYINQGGTVGPDDSVEFADDGGDMGDEWAGGSSSGSSNGFGSGAGSSSSGSQGFRGGVATSQNGSGNASGLRGTGSATAGGGSVASNGNMQPRSGELGFAGTQSTGQANGGQAGTNGMGANGQPGGTSYFADGGTGQAGAENGSYFASGTGDAQSFNGNGIASGDGTGDVGNGAFADSSSRTAASGGSATGGSGANGAAGAGGSGAGPGGPAGMLGGSSSTAPNSGGGGAGAASMGGMNSMAADPASDPTASPTGDSTQPAGPPSLNMDMTRNSNQAGQAGQASQQSEPVARQKGRNWAWSEGPPSKTAVVRTIRVVCYNDRWVLMQDNAASNQVTIAIGQSPQQSAERLAKAITDRVSGWGIALGGGYWKPELVVDVAPGAEARCAQLERLLEGSGLTVKRRTAK